MKVVDGTRSRVKLEILLSRRHEATFSVSCQIVLDLVLLAPFCASRLYVSG